MELWSGVSGAGFAGRTPLAVSGRRPSVVVAGAGGGDSACGGGEGGRKRPVRQCRIERRYSRADVGSRCATRCPHVLPVLGVRPARIPQHAVVGRHRQAHPGNRSVCRSRQTHRQIRPGAARPTPVGRGLRVRRDRRKPALQRQVRLRGVEKNEGGHGGLRAGIARCRRSFVEKFRQRIHPVGLDSHQQGHLPGHRKSVCHVPAGTHAPRPAVAVFCAR